MFELINSFPREVGFTARVLVKSMNEFINLIDKYNGIKTIYFSVFLCTEERDYDNSKINLIPFDFDHHNTEEILKFSDYCLNQDLFHMILFSGNKGFHFY